MILSENHMFIIKTIIYHKFKTFCSVSKYLILFLEFFNFSKLLIYLEINVKYVFFFLNLNIIADERNYLRFYIGVYTLYSYATAHRAKNCTFFNWNVNAYLLIDI